MNTLRALAPKSAMPAKPDQDAPAGDAEAPLDRGDSWDEEQMFQMICENAYYRAERRGFAPGEELADWLAAEAEVRTQLSTPRG